MFSSRFSESAYFCPTTRALFLQLFFKPSSTLISATEQTNGNFPTSLNCGTILERTISRPKRSMKTELLADKCFHEIKFPFSGYPMLQPPAIARYLRHLNSSSRFFAHCSSFALNSAAVRLLFFSLPVRCSCMFSKAFLAFPCPFA